MIGHIRARHRLLAIIAATIVSLLPNAAAYASHQANCSEYGVPIHWNGYVSSSWSNHRWAVKGTLEDQGFDLCLNPRVGEGSDSTAWVAIQGPGPFDILQSGAGKCRPATGDGCDSTMRDGYAGGRTQTSPGCSGYMSRLPEGTWFNSWSGGGGYSVTYTAAENWRFGTPTHEAFLFDSAACWTNTAVSVFGETHDYGVGGSPADHFNISNRQFKTSPTGSWITLPDQCNGRISADDPPFKCSAANGIMELWTDR